MKVCSAWGLAACAMLSGCGWGGAPTYTLYRTSTVAPGARIHWGTFDASESDPAYNLANCTMAARLLTANMKVLGGETYDPAKGFWCEEGSYRQLGETPRRFEATFPTDTE